MTSRNCLFNFKLFVKTLFQQKYVMLIHTAVLLLSTTLIAYLGYMQYSNDGYIYSVQDAVEYLSLRQPLIIPMVIAASFISAYLGFSHFYKRSSAVFFGAIPVKRSCMYITKLCACLASVIVPVLLSAVVNFVVYNLVDFKITGVETVSAGVFWGRVGYVLLQYILYTSIFSFAAVVSGNGFAQLITAGFVCLVYPVTFLITSGFIDVALETWSANLNPDGGYMFPAAYIMDGEIAVRYYVFSAIVAVCAALAGLFLYIKRRNEKSGEFYGFGWINTLLKYYISMCTAMLTYLVVKSAFGNNGGFIPLVMGIIFGVLMFAVLRGIFEKSFKAMFSKPKFLGIYLVAAIFVLCAAEFDIFGFDKRVGEIETVRISAVDTYICDENNDDYVITLDSPECISAVYEVAEAGMSNSYYETDWRIVELVVNENPLGFRRRFKVSAEAYNKFVSVVYDSEDYKEDYIAFVESRYDDSFWRIYDNGISNIIGETKTEFWNLLMEDIRNHSYSEIRDSVIAYNFNLEPVTGYRYFGQIPVYSCFENTVKFIEDKFPSVVTDTNTEKNYD